MNLLLTFFSRTSLYLNWNPKDDSICCWLYILFPNILLLALLFPLNKLLLLFEKEKLFAFWVIEVLNNPPPLLALLLLFPKRLFEVEPKTPVFWVFPNRPPPWLFPKRLLFPPPNKLLFFCGVVGAAPRVPILPNKDIF